MFGNHPAGPDKYELFLMVTTALIVAYAWNALWVFLLQLNPVS
jgi:hypothetical protein